jgi:uncharacterized protein with HEPN domain
MRPSEALEQNREALQQNRMTLEQSRMALEQNRMAIRAVVRSSRTTNPQVFGERFPAFCENHPEIAWSSIRGLRNRIAHDGFSLDVKVVWDTVEFNPPTLLQQVAVIMDGDV